MEVIIYKYNGNPGLISFFLGCLIVKVSYFSIVFGITFILKYIFQFLER